MSGGKRGAALHGWVVLDKPEGMGSTSASSAVRKLSGARKAGHAGTLDPFATGLLPVALGEATKTIPYIVEARKAYRFTLRWGVETDSCDRDGQETARSPVRPASAAIEAALQRFTGIYEQTPPVYSAVRINGVRAYSLARTGRAQTPPPRRVQAHDLRLLDRPDADSAVFEVVCGKGFYVRSLGRDLAHFLGTVGHLTALRRTRTGPFTEKDAISLAEIEQRAHKPSWQAEVALPLEAALDGIPALFLDEGEVASLYGGRPVPLLKKTDLPRVAEIENSDVALAFGFGRAIGMVRYERGEAKPVRMFVYGTPSQQGS